MSSKLLRIFLFSVFGLVTSCSLPVGEKPPATDPIQVKLGDSTACLSKVSPTLTQYFDGVASDAQVVGVWNCVSTAITTFQDQTKGRYEDRYTSRELAHFIEQYFMKEGSRIPDPLLLQVFRIKQLFIGGAVDSISRAEMVQIQSVIETLKKITLNLNPHMKVLTLNWKVSDPNRIETSIPEFEDTNSAVQQAARDLGDLIQKNGVTYHLDDVVERIFYFQ